MAEQSLITDELRALKGRTGTSRPVKITDELVHRSMGVYRHGQDPVHFEEGAVVPESVLLILAPNRGESEIHIPDPLPKSLMVSTEISVKRPLRMGDSFQARARVGDISERLGGRFGHVVHIRTEVEFLETSGEVAASTATTMMFYDPKNDNQRAGQ